MKTIDDILNNENIKLDHAIIRVAVKDVNKVPFPKMNAEKPANVEEVMYSNDPERNKTSILVMVTGEYDISEMAAWLKQYDILQS